MPETDPARVAWLQRVLGLTLSDPRSQPDISPDRSATPGLADRIAALEPRYLAALRAAPDERTSLVAAWEFAGEQARDGRVAAAEAALDTLQRRIDSLLAAPAASDPAKFGIREGIVAERRGELEALFAQRIGTAKTQAGGEIGRLKRALGEIIEEPEALVAAVRSAILRLLDQLQSELETAVSSGSEDDVGAILGAWHDRIDADPVVRALREACDELDEDVPFDAIVQALMDAIVNELQPAPA